AAHPAERGRRARPALPGRPGPGGLQGLMVMPASTPLRTAALQRMAARGLPWLLAGLLLATLWPATTLAQATLPALTTTPGPDGSQTWSLSVQTLVMLTMLSFLPAALLMMTGFTRIIIVLGLLRNALGTGVS